MGRSPPPPPDPCDEGDVVKAPADGVYEFIIDQTTDDPAQMIQYTGANADVTPAKMCYEGDRFLYGGWKDTWLMKAFKPCMLHADGSVEYYLNPDNLSQKADGSDATSDLTSTEHDMNAMVEVSQIWIKEEEIDEDHFHIYLSPTKADGYDCWTHYNSNHQLVDKYYYAMYRGSLDSNNKMRSLSEQTIYNPVSSIDKLKACQANGAGWSCRDWYFQRLMQYVLMLIGKSTNTQKVFGNGCVSGSVFSPTSNSKQKGLFWGSDQTNQHVYVFGMEDLWGNMFDYCDGIEFFCSEDSNKINDEESYFRFYHKEDSTYTDVSFNSLNKTILFSTQNIATMYLIPGFGLIPKNSGSTSNVGYFDYYYEQDVNHTYSAHVGGQVGYYQQAGVFCMTFSDGQRDNTGNQRQSSISLSFTPST